jgi:hypothetical protein
MSDSFERLMSLNDEAVRLCRIVFENLQDERLALISLDTPRISELLMQKEHHVQMLDNCRTKIGMIFTKEFQVDTPEAFEALLSVEQFPRWAAARTLWQNEWAKVVMLGNQNQTFLKHSMKNLSKFADHLKQLLGEPSRYSSKGDKVESSSEGRVLEASF